jgi:hypothetical protein
VPGARNPDRDTRRQRGAFFTPDEVATRLLQTAMRAFAAAGRVLPAGALLDPACGDGSFLRAAARTDVLRNRVLRGCDVDGGALAKAAGVGEVQRGDGLVLPPEEGTFAAVVGNPPFASDHLKRLSDFDLVRTTQWYAIPTVGDDGRPGEPTSPARLRTFNIATLFAERFVRLAAPGGLVVIVLPTSFLANRKDRGHRHFLLRHARLLRVETLRPGTFAAEGTAAATAVLTLVRRELPLGGPQAGTGEDVALAADGVELGSASTHALIEAGRWDPPFLLTLDEDPMAACLLPVEPLGTFVAELVYGGIATGRRPVAQDDGVWYVTQKAVGEHGVDLGACPRIRAEAPFVTDRIRLRPGDLVVPRCGAGTLAKNRLTRFDHDAPAVVDCFCDLLRLRGISSAWVLGFLRSPAGWAQIQRRIQGVGTPNLSFADLRAIRLPVPGDALAGAAEATWSRIRAGVEPFGALVALVQGGMARGG